MKGYNALRALVLGSALSFGNALAPILKLPSPTVTVTVHRGKGKGRHAPAKWRRTVTVSANRPRPTSPEGRTRVEAAELKRARRALTADRNAYRSWCANPCLSGSDRHNPTFVNRSE